MNKPKNLIIWDWNGTLLNDVDYCVQCMNVLLRRRNLPLIDNRRYREIFTFPVKDYYRAVGIDVEHEGFEKPAMEFIKLYFDGFEQTELFTCAPEVLETFHRAGKKQVVLSAMHHESLVETLKEKNIFSYFDEVAGVGDHYGTSKEETGLALMRKLKADPAETVMIGDTTHDVEVAAAIGVDALLLATGHNDRARLEKTKVPVLDKLADVIPLLRHG